MYCTKHAPGECYEGCPFAYDQAEADLAEGILKALASYGPTAVSAARTLMSHDGFEAYQQADGEWFASAPAA